MLEERTRDFLRRKAREAAAHAVGLRPSGAVAGSEEIPGLPGLSGLFVTWLKDGRPRGRSGTLAPDAPLVDLVAKHAVDALLHDPRVPPATAKEFPRYAPRISALSSFEEISSSSDVVVGTHGVVVEKGKRWGVVLPEDAEGLSWDGARLLGQACLRAGLPEEAWSGGGAVRLRRFTAETF